MKTTTQILKNLAKAILFVALFQFPAVIGDAQKNHNWQGCQQEILAKAVNLQENDLNSIRPLLITEVDANTGMSGGYKTADNDLDFSTLEVELAQAAGLANISAFSSVDYSNGIEEDAGLETLMVEAALPYSTTQYIAAENDGVGISSPDASLESDMTIASQLYNPSTFSNAEEQASAGSSNDVLEEMLISAARIYDARPASE